MYLQDVISEALHSPESALAYDVSRRLAQHFPDRAIVEGNDYDFDLDDFVKGGKCAVRRAEDVHTSNSVAWNADTGIIDFLRHGWFEVEWKGESLDVLLIFNADSCQVYHWILADSMAVARAFYADVCAFEPEHSDELLLFDGGRWTTSAKLFQEIQTFSFANLILPIGLKNAVRNEAERFFKSRAIYDRHKAPWKRGLLLTGPPGNGKTHAIKSLAQSVEVPCLYVRSFESERRIEPTNMRVIFQKARRVAPCLLIFEDLDSLVNDENRSYFLNEMDGFAANAGIFTVATTNHPEKLDPAILDRPSRFDRVYHFGLPALAERTAYLQLCQTTYEDDARLDVDALTRVAARTDGFSYATLKELMLSSLLEWIAGGFADAIETVVDAQIDLLKVPRSGQAPLGAASRPVESEAG